MTKFIPSGGSLNHVSGRARHWFFQVEQKADWSLPDQIESVRNAWEIAERFCAIVNCPLSLLIARASGKPSVTQPLLAVPDVLSRSIDLACRDLENDSTRYTAKSRAKWGILLVRFVVTLARFGDLNLLKIVTAKRTGADGSIRKESEALPDSTSGSDADPVAAIEARLTTGQVQDCAALFRKAITASSAEVASASAGTSIPENFGLDLQGLHRLTQNMLGRVNVRGDLLHVFEPATPQRMQIDHETLPAYVSLNKSQIDAEGVQVSGVSDRPSEPAVSEVITSRHFQRPQWDLQQADTGEIDEDQFRSVVKAVKRRRVTVEGPSHQPLYSYGIHLKIESAFAAGESVIGTGLSGTGKSTLLANLVTSGATIFQIGGEKSTARKNHHVYTISEADEMIKKALRTRGRKILISHEFFIGPRLFERLGIFDQFALMGDPRQPGAWGDARHLFRFIKEIGGRSFTLPVVWRSSNPLSMMIFNYVAYGSRFKICSREFNDATGVQFEYFTCDDSSEVVAASMLAYALQKASAGKSVLIGAGNAGTVQVLIRLISISETSENLHCVLLSDLQGREADVLVVDLHDVAVSTPKPDEALRFFIMLLGRARETTCFALGTRNMCVDPELALPAEVYAGVVLRYRVRSTETKTLSRSGRNFDLLSRQFNLVAIDEETIALMNVRRGVTDIMLIKNRESHNASMIKDAYVTIEAPEFFSKQDIERGCSILLYFTVPKRVPAKGRVYDLSEIALFAARHN